MRTNVPRALRALRRQRGWRQHDLGQLAGLSRDVVQRIEANQLRGVTVGSLDHIVSALDAHLVIEIRWRGAEVDRLTDSWHAALVAKSAERLRQAGWVTYAEVTFNHFGDRGSCDLVAWHPGLRVLLIVEVKSRLGNLQEALGRLDVKARLGSIIAEQLGFGQPRLVVPAFVLAEDGANRRLVASHAPLFDRYGVRGRAALAWLRRPEPRASGLLWYESSPLADEGRTRRPRAAPGRRGAG
jgi:transcriptional regulator with XRE-family HTH domain